MDKDDLLRRARDPKNIPGIYNYCDRWCERCAFTSRCLNYDPREKFADPAKKDIANQAFWDELQETMETTMEMIREMAEEEGIDLDEPPPEEYVKEQEKIRKAARDHEVARLSHRYSKMVDEWFKGSEGAFKEKGDELGQQVLLDLPRTSPLVEAISLEDAVEVIRWYQHFIHVKLQRALHGMMEGVPEGLEDYPKDSDGSAKIALIGMDRSIAAWGEMRKFFPEKEDAILNQIVFLDRLREKTEKAFPEARAFVRPGFDDPPR